MTTANDEIGLTVTGRKPSRPPMQRIVVDLALHNADPEPRWFLVPAHTEHWAAEVSVDGVEPVALGNGAVVLGTFQGTGGFVALLLAGGAKVVVRGLELSSSKPVHSVDVRIARELTVGDKPARAWFPADPTSKSATVDYAGFSPLASQHTSDRSEVKVSFDLVRTQTVALP
jgi:hypothetical protein